jgi:hypothetical protein
LQKKLWILRAIKRICNINLLNEMSEKERIEMTINISSTEMNDNMSSFRFGKFSFANTVIRILIHWSKASYMTRGAATPWHTIRIAFWKKLSRHLTESQSLMTEWRWSVMTLCRCLTNWLIKP